MKYSLRVVALLVIAVFQHHCGSTSALRAQAPTAKPISGTVTEFKPAALEIGVKPDSGETVLVKVGPETEVVQVPPGERDLSQARPARLTSLSRGDRVLVSFVTGLAEARRIVWITATDIATRNQAERMDWQTRGISGIVTGIHGDQIALEIRTPQGAHTATVMVTGRTNIRRYAPDSVKFADAVASSTAEIGVGDQLQARGQKSEAGAVGGTGGGTEASAGHETKVTAHDLVFGTFLTRLGSITAVNREANEIQIQEVTTKQPLTIRIDADSRLKKMPDMRAILTGKPTEGYAQDPAHFDLQQALERLPVATIDDLKIGGGVIVTATRGARDGQVTAIMLLANADFLVRMAQGQADGEHGGGMEALGKLHGGMLAGPGGISLPTMIQ
ncbi:MAG TPA: hypothetical protein VNY05_25655 [Candidatus Acidoferrales bacterium]|jgi:hypothetical protein|nr:hypothetical protein [Candidatus Acidoferrales bacterium]